MGFLADLFLGGSRGTGLRRYLERRLEETLVEKFLRAGFQKVALQKREDNAESRRVHALGRLQRKRDDNIDIVEIELDKRGFPDFLIRAGIAPPEGATSAGYYLEQDLLTTVGCPDAVTTFMDRKKGSSFSLGLFDPKSNSSIDRIVSLGEAAADQVLVWFDTRELGPNLMDERPFKVIAGRVPGAIDFKDVQDKFL